MEEPLPGRQPQTTDVMWVGGHTERREVAKRGTGKNPGRCGMTGVGDDIGQDRRKATKEERTILL